MYSPISNLYRQLLRRFNFSIGGYSNPEKEVSDFFYKLCKNELIYQNESIRLLMFGFAQLSVNDINEIDLDKWETKPLSKFNYFDYSSGYAEVLLSLYIHCLNEICDNKRATNIISESIRRDINLRIFIDKSEKKFQFRENKRLEALEIIVPGNIFNDIDLAIDLNAFKDSKNAEIKNFVTQDEEFEHEYKIDSTTQTQFKQCYEELAKKVLKIQPKEFLNAIDTYLPSKSIQEKIKQKTLRNPNANLAEILAVAYSASLFCYFFDCSVEYFVSVSNVSLDKKYSLGSIAVGIINGAELSFDERAMFSIISNHIASNLSAQIIFKNNEAIKLRDQRRNFKKLFDKYGKVLDQGNKDRSHANDKVDSDVLTQWKQQAEDNLDFAKPFVAIEDKYSDYLKLNEKTHQGLLLNVYLDKQGSKESFLRGKNLFYSSIVRSGFNGFKYDYIDIILLNEFLKLLHENKGGDTKGNNIAIECKHEGNKQNGIKNKRFEISVEFVGSDSQFRISDFYSKLKTAHSSTGTNFTSFILNNYELLRIHGDLEITDSKGVSHFLLSRDARLNTKDTKNPFLEITKENIPIDSYEHLNFIIHIQHDLK